MALLHYQHFSNALGMASACFVTIPEGVKPPYRTVYLLHGHSDDHTIWQRRTSIERYAERHGIAVVMPDGGRGWYVDPKDGVYNYERHILETVERIDALLPTRHDRDGRGIGGLSMGGYGCLKIGLKYPALFGSITSHSGALDIKTWHRNSPRSGQLQTIFGPKLAPSEDCFALAKKLVKARIRPRIRIDCGSEDFLIEHNRSIHRHLVKLGIPHEYDEYPGSHNWEYWDEHIQTALAFHATSDRVGDKNGNQIVRSATRKSKKTAAKQPTSSKKR
jgi:putative tributyrin esterase